MRVYAGNAPAQDEGWMLVGECADNGKDGPTWLVFVRPQDLSHEWVTVKVVFSGSTKKKANYWLSKNIKTGRIALSRDFSLMRAHRPTLCRAVENVLQGADFCYGRKHRAANV